MKNNRRNYAIMFSLLFWGSFIVLNMINNIDCYFDSDVYWSLGRDCGWNVKNLGWGFRGWLLPYSFSMCYKFGMLFDNEFLGYRIFSSFTFSFMFTYIYKRISEILELEYLDKNISIYGGISGIIFWIFFRGLFIYTLSDVYALCFSFVSVIMLYDIIKNDEKLHVKAIKSCILGLFLYGTYNIRTIYLVFLIACCIVLTVWQLINKKYIQTVVTFACNFIGMAICSIPQYIVNYNLLGTRSWKVPTEGLMLYQLQWGITADRYATYIGDSENYGTAGMFFVDKIGQAILEREQITELDSYGQLFKLVLRYPIDFIGIYMRHFLNMLYPIYPNQYIKDITRDKSLFLLLFFTVLFIAICNFVNAFKLKSSRWIWLGLILISCVCILPGAVEIRFFIALHFIIYMYAISGIKDFIIKWKNNKARYIIMYIIGLCIYFAYAGTMLSSTQAGMAIINNL